MSSNEMMDEKILSLFRTKKTDYVSGEELSKILGISRSAIWKHVEKLRGEGYDIEAQPHLGYKLVGIPDKLLPSEVGWKLGTRIIGKKIYLYDVVDSTMDIALRLATDGADEGTVIFAEGQTKGRGRIGRSWASPKNKGIYLSIVFRPQILPVEASKITILAAVSLAKAIRNNTKLLSLIKWPNDILIGGQKVCGILTEMSAEMDRVKFLILGIGVNVNAKKKNLSEGATSIMEEVGEKVSRVNLAREILREIDKNYLSFNQNGFDTIIEQWRNLSAILGSQVEISYRDRKIEGQAQDIDSNGALLIRLDSGFCERVLAGDVVKVR